MKRQRIVEAESFVPYQIRQSILAQSKPELPTAYMSGRGVVVSCDVSRFTFLSDTYLSKGDAGVDTLHKILDQHFRFILEAIVGLGGKPLFFFGDALLSVWDGDDGHAAQSALAAALHLAQCAADTTSVLPLNIHVASGDLSFLELGGHNDQYHFAATGSAMAALQDIGGLRAPNQVIATREVIAEAHDITVDDTAAWDRAHIVTGAPHQTEKPPEPPNIPEDALSLFLARSPKPVRRWFSSLGLEWAAEQRPVTAVVTTLRDFDQAAPDAAQRLQNVVRRVQECVHAHDGTIDNVMIDDKGAAIFSVFGAPPDAHADDPARGVVSAIDIQAALSDAGQSATTAVCTGRAFCAPIGNRWLRTYMVVGEAVTYASRLSAAMEQDAQVLVDAATMRATDALIGYAATPASFEVKGVDRAIPAWTVPPRESWTVQDRGFSGRELELGRLRVLWSKVWNRKVSAGMRITGEAGSGKTTLASALRDTIVRQGGRFLTIESTRVNRDIPFAGLRLVTMEALGLNGSMSPTQRAKVIAKALPQDTLDHAPLLNALFRSGLEETHATQQLSGRARAKALENLLCRIIVSAFGDTRVCLCFEDAHWLDPNAAALLNRLLTEAPSLMILALEQAATEQETEPEPYDALWEHMALGPLDRGGLDALIRNSLGCTQVAAALLDRISEVSSGHPFFAAEVLQSLVDADLVTCENGVAQLIGDDAANIPLPLSIDGAVLNRLDQLQPGSQVTLRSVSVAGQTFSLDLAVDIHPLHIERAVAVGHLTDHVHRGFLDPHMIADAQGYSFRHGIVRDVAYRQVPAATRRSLHARVAEWLENLGDRPVIWGQAELAHHWAEAGETGRAIDYLAAEAGRVFSQGFATNAVALGAQAVRYSGLEMPKDDAEFMAAVSDCMGEVARLIGTTAPTGLDLSPTLPEGQTGLQIKALIAIAPFAFQSNQFPVYAWASATAVRLLLAEGASNAHAFSLFSVVVTALTQERGLGAAWSRAALDLDAANGGQGLGPVGFIDTWFHGHWRDPLSTSVETNRLGALSAAAQGDMQYASYNIAGQVVMAAASGQPLPDVIALGSEALARPLVRNSAMQIHLEVQCARALRGEALAPGSLDTTDVREADHISWVLDTEFVNQIGYYRATQVRLKRYLGDWRGALNAAEAARAVGYAISGQTAEVDMVFHSALAGLCQVIESKVCNTDDIEEAMPLLTAWAALQPANFHAKAQILSLTRSAVLEGKGAQRVADLVALAETDIMLQDRAIALEMAAMLSGSEAHIVMAANAYRDWGATAVANRLLQRMDGRKMLKAVDAETSASSV